MMVWFGKRFKPHFNKAFSFQWFIFSHSLTTFENDVFNVFGVTVTKDRLLQYSFSPILLLYEKADIFFTLIKRTVAQQKQAFSMEHTWLQF